MGFYGKITNTSKTQFTFDRTYPNRATMDKHCNEDGVYVGRFVLVEYDNIPIDSAILSNNPIRLKDANGNDLAKPALRYPADTYNNTCYFWEDETIRTSGHLSSESLTEEEIADNNLGPNIMYDPELKDGDIVFIPSNRNYSRIHPGDLILAIKGKKITQTSDELCYYKYEFDILDESASYYYANYKIDKTRYGVSRGYDSTVWEKIYSDKPEYQTVSTPNWENEVYYTYNETTGAYAAIRKEQYENYGATQKPQLYKITSGGEKYVMIAELNTVVPTFTLTADAPTPSPVKPHFGPTQSNVAYDLHWQPNWGFRIKGANNGLNGDNWSNWIPNDATEPLKYVSSDDTTYASDMKTSWERTIYDEKTGKIQHITPDNLEDYTPYDAAIYFNKAGFSPEEIHYYNPTEKDSSGIKKSENAINSINLTPTGVSGELYNTHPEDANGKVFQKAPDIQELNIQLPGLGDAVAKMWDLVYGDYGQNDNHIERTKDVTWYSGKGRDENIVPVSFEPGVTKPDGTTIPKRLRMIEKAEGDDNWTYSTEKVETLAGAINSVHDLMGMIIINLNDIIGEEQGKYSLEEYFKNYADDKHIYYYSGKYYRRWMKTIWISLDEDFLDIKYYYINADNKPVELTDSNIIRHLVLNADGTTYSIYKDEDGTLYEPTGDELLKMPKFIITTDPSDKDKEIYIKINNITNITSNAGYTLGLVDQAHANDYSYFIKVDFDDLNNYDVDDIYYIKDRYKYFDTNNKEWFKDSTDYSLNNPFLSENGYEAVDIIEYQPDTYYYGDRKDYILETNEEALVGRDYYKKDNEKIKNYTITGNFEDPEKQYYYKENNVYRPVEEYSFEEEYYDLEEIITEEPGGVDSSLLYLTYDDGKVAYIAGAYYYRHLVPINSTGMTRFDIKSCPDPLCFWRHNESDNKWFRPYTTKEQIQEAFNNNNYSWPADLYVESGDYHSTHNLQLGTLKKWTPTYRIMGKWEATYTPQHAQDYYYVNSSGYYTKITDDNKDLAVGNNYYKLIEDENIKTVFYRIIDVVEGKEWTEIGGNYFSKNTFTFEPTNATPIFIDSFTDGFSDEGKGGYIKHVDYEYREHKGTIGDKVGYYHLVDGEYKEILDAKEVKDDETLYTRTRIITDLWEYSTKDGRELERYYQDLPDTNEINSYHIDKTLPYDKTLNNYIMLSIPFRKVQDSGIKSGTEKLYYNDIEKPYYDLVSNNYICLDNHNTVENKNVLYKFDDNAFTQVYPYIDKEYYYNDNGKYILDEDNYGYSVHKEVTFTENKPYEKNKYYYKNEKNEFILSKDETPKEALKYYEIVEELKENLQYYKEKKFYVSSSSIDEYREGEEWNNNVYPIPDGVTLSKGEKIGYPQELKYFGRSLNTIHGLILRIRAMLEDGDKLTRDTSTVQGCINKLNDIINHLGDLQINNLLKKDKWISIDGSTREGAQNLKPVITFNKLWNNKQQLLVKSSYLKDIPLIDFDKDDELNSSPKILGSYTLEELIKGKKIKRDDNGNPILDANGNEENDKIPQFMFTDGDDDATKRAGHLAWFKISDGGIGSTPNILSDGSGLGINTDNATVLNNYSLYVNGKTNLNGDTVINPTNGSKNYTLEVKGTTNITGATSIGGDVTIGGKTNITGATTIGGTLTLTGGLSNKLIFGARNKNYSYEKTATTYNGKETINIQVARWGTSEPSNTENPGDFIGQLYIVISN